MILTTVRLTSIYIASFLRDTMSARIPTRWTSLLNRLPRPRIDTPRRRAHTLAARDEPPNALSQPLKSPVSQIICIEVVDEIAELSLPMSLASMVGRSVAEAR